MVFYFSILRITVTSDNGHGTLIIRDVKESDQGAYTCEAINAKGLVFGIPDGVLTLISNPNQGTDTSLGPSVNVTTVLTTNIKLCTLETVG